MIVIGLALLFVLPCFLVMHVACRAAVFFRNRTNRIHKPKRLMAFGILLTAGSAFTFWAYVYHLILIVIGDSYASIYGISLFALVINMVFPILGLLSGICILQLEEWARRLLLALVILGLVTTILPLVLSALGCHVGSFSGASRFLLVQILCFPWYTAYFRGEGISFLIVAVYVFIITPMKLAFYVLALVYFNKRRIKSLFNWRSEAVGNAVGPTAHNRP